MEKKKLTEKESLELITQMIQESRERIARYAAYPLLIWGYMTLLLSLVMWYVIERYDYWTIQFIWFLLPVVCYPATRYFSRKDRSEQLHGAHYRADMDRVRRGGTVAFPLLLLSGTSRKDQHLFLYPPLDGDGLHLDGVSQ